MDTVDNRLRVFQRVGIQWGLISFEKNFSAVAPSPTTITLPMVGTNALTGRVINLMEDKMNVVAAHHIV